MISIRAFHFFHYLSLCVYKTVLQKAFTLSSSNHHLPFAWPSCERYVQVTKSLYVTKPREKNKINLCIMNPISFEKGFKQIKSNVPPPTHPQITRTKDNKGQCKESAWKTDIWNTCLEHQFKLSLRMPTSLMGVLRITSSASTFHSSFLLLLLRLLTV